MGACWKGAVLGATGLGAQLCPSCSRSVLGSQLGYRGVGREVAVSGEGGGCIFPDDGLWQLQSQVRDFPLLVPSGGNAPSELKDPGAWQRVLLSPVQWGGLPTFTDTQQQVRIRLCSSESRTESSSSSCPRPFPSMMREPMAFPMSANDGAAAAKGRSLV